MSADSLLSSIPGGVVSLHSASEEQDWQPILHSSNQVVLYNPKSHALSISRFSSSHDLTVRNNACPYCRRTLPEGFEHFAEHSDFDEVDPMNHTRKPDYFHLLATANENASVPPSLTAHEDNGLAELQSEGHSRAFPPNTLAEGYFKRFFQEEYKLGMGANGSVYLCQHVLDRNKLGHFAVKKIAVGESHSYLLAILREVRLLERLHHPNIITYHHAWLETCQFSSFGPRVPTLHVLMQWAEGGSLDDFIDIRLGRGSPHVHINPFGAFSSSPNPGTSTEVLEPRNPSNDVLSPNPDSHSRSARIRAFRAYQRATPAEQERMRRETLFTGGRILGRRPQSLKAVHLLSADEVKSLFRDVVEGLCFLHDRSILHLDLKPGNVLLTWDEGKLIPRAMLSDFGTSREMIGNSPVRSGNTGTLEYSSPESVPSPTGVLRDVNSKSDMWSLGMILHKLLFFKLPYRYAADGDKDDNLSGDQHTGRRSRLGEAEKLRLLEQEVLDYPGFKSNPDFVTTFETRRISRNFLILLEGLLNKSPNTRPSCERISNALKEGKLDPLKESPKHNDSVSLVPLARCAFVASTTVEPVLPSGELTEQSQEAMDGNETIISAPLRRMSILGPPPSDSPSSMDVTQNKTETQAQSLKARWHKKVFEFFAKHQGSLARFTKSSVLAAKVLSLSTVCSCSCGFLRLGLPSMLIGAALVDATVEMTLFGHAVFLVFHALGIKVGCTYGYCCS